MKRQFTYMMAFATGLSLLAAGLLSTPLMAKSPPDVDIQIDIYGNSVVFQVDTSRDLLSLNVRVVGPQRYLFEDRIELFNALEWIPELELADGHYRWEAWVVTANPGAAMRDLPPEMSPEITIEHFYDFEVTQTHISSGSLQLNDGVLETPAERRAVEEATRVRRIAGAVLNFLIPSAQAQNFTDNVVVTKSVPEVRYEHTGTGARNWATGYNALAGWYIRDLSANTFPLVVRDAAPNNSLIIGGTGNIGIGTGSPQNKLHVENSGGWQIRLATSAATTQHRLDSFGGQFAIGRVGIERQLVVRNDAPENSLWVHDNGNIGVGTGAPAYPIHVQRANNSAQFRVEDTGASSVQTMFTVENNGHTRFRMRNAAQDVNWDFRTAGSGATEQFQITRFSTADGSSFPFRLINNGDLEILGTLSENSSRAVKEQIVELTTETILGRLKTLPVLEWSYQANPGVRHVGPMAEEFHAAFALGKDNTRISPRDLAGVALAAAKALNERLEQENSELRKLNQAIEARVERLEASLNQHL